MIAGMFLVYLRNKRCFERENDLGVERYPSYLDKLKSTSVDKMILYTGYLLIAWPIMLLIFFDSAYSVWVVFAIVVYLFFIRSRSKPKSNN